MDVRIGLQRKLSAEEMILLNCGVGEEFESPLDFKEIQPVYPKGDQSWIFTGRTDAEAETPILLATWCEEVTHLKRPWCWERLKVEGEGGIRGWDCWMASLTQWKWVWVNSGNWWWTGRPGVLQSMGSQRVGHSWVNELNWIIILLLNYQTSSLWADADHCWFCCSVAKLCPTFCHPMDCSTPGFPVLCWFLKFDQIGT